MLKLVTYLFKSLLPFCLILVLFFMGSCNTCKPEQNKESRKWSRSQEKSGNNVPEEPEVKVKIPVRPEYSDFAESKTCKNCHPTQFKDWNRSLHSMSHTEPVYNIYFIKASIDTGQKSEAFCAGCHTPVARLSGSIPFKIPPRGIGDTTVKSNETRGVTCDICHRIEGIKEGSQPDQIKNGEYIFSVSKDKLGTLKNSETSAHGSVYSEFHKSPEFCGGCHQGAIPPELSGGKAGLSFINTYSEWKKSPWAAEGVTCRDCHGPSHYCVGPNLLYNSIPGSEELRRLSIELLKKSAVLTIQEATRDDKGLNLVVSVKNQGAGHYLPTGLTGLRQLWLEVVVTEPEGTLLGHLGALNKELVIADNTVIFGTVWADSKGVPTTRFWQANQVLSDNRIPPREEIISRLTVPISGDWEELEVEVVLKYRSLPPTGLKEVNAPRRLIKVVPFEVASERTVIRSTGPSKSR